MDLFNSLFGKKQKGSAISDDELANSPVQGASQRGKLTSRIAYCDCCGKDRQASVADDGRFIGQAIVVSKEPSKGMAFVGACERCDIDVCGECAKWVHDTSMIDEMRKNLPDAEQIEGHPGVETSTLLDFYRQLAQDSYRSICPKCDGEFVSKTNADIARLENGLASLDNAMLAGKQVEVRQLALRMLRICCEESPVFSKAFGQGEFDKMRMNLMNITSR